MAKKLHHAFKQEYNGITDVLKTEVFISNIELPENKPTPDKFLQINAIWDTGATGSVITSGLAQKLNLKPIDMVTVSGVGGNILVNAYFVNIILQTSVNPIIFPMRRVTEGILGEFDALIGMDIIQQGDFCISNGKGKTAFSYSVPPSDNKLCLLERAEKINKRK